MIQFMLRAADYDTVTPSGRAPPVFLPIRRGLEKVWGSMKPTENFHKFAAEQASPQEEALQMDAKAKA